jgi:hypothetical protein
MDTDTSKTIYEYQEYELPDVFVIDSNINISINNCKIIYDKKSYGVSITKVIFL